MYKYIFSVILLAKLHASDIVSYHLYPDDKGYGYNSEGFHHIEPEFIAAAKDNLHILEIGGADGATMRKVLQQAIDKKISITYTILDINNEHRKNLFKIKEIIDNNHKNINIIIPDNGDVKDFIKNNNNKYDLIYAGMIFHFLNPLDYLAVLRAMHKTLSDDGQLFMTQSSINGPSFNKAKKLMKDAEDNGDLWPGFITDQERLALDLLRASYYKETFAHMDVFKTEQSVTSITKLLKYIGFSIVSAQDFMDKLSIIHMPEGDIQGVPYLGVIAKKTYPENEEMIKRYMEQAQQKCALLKKHLIDHGLYKLAQCHNPSCHHQEVSLKKCMRCKSVEYCSKDCQIQHWPIHKSHCLK